MKLLLALTVFLALSVLLILADSKVDLNDLKKQAEICREKVGATADEINNFIEFKEPGTAEGKCLFSCLMKHYKALNEDGSVSLTNILENTKKYYKDDAATLELVKNTVAMCNKEVVPADECDTAVLYAKCFLEHAKIRPW